MTVHFNRQRRRWAYDFVRGGRRYQGYCLDADGSPVTSRRAAVTAEEVEKHRVGLRPKLPSAGGLTLTRLFADLSELWRHQADWPNKRVYIAELLDWFGPAEPVAAIDEARIRSYAAWSLARPRRVWKGGPRRRDDPADARFWKEIPDRRRGPATTNLYLNVLRQALDRARQIRDSVTGRPALEDPPPVPRLPVPKRRARPVPEDVLGDVLAAAPAHVAEAIVVTLHFGLRRGEAFGLTIDQVDQAARGIWLEAERVKDREDAFLPGSPAAMAYLARLAAQARARGVRHLIAWRREKKGLGPKEGWRPIRSPKTAWKTAMARIEAAHGRRWRWHDIRAAFITDVARRSGPLAAQALARHSDFATTQLYIDVAADEIRAAADATATRPALRVVGENSLTPFPDTGGPGRKKPRK